MASSKSIRVIYQTLLKSFGRQHWWPGDTSFEIIIGAILTQNTNWGNVEKAIVQLKHDGLLTPGAMRDVPVNQLAQAIRPAGYFNLKARRLKNFTDFLFERYEGDLRRMEKVSLDVLRPQLLGVNGIGPETADSILLYAFQKPVFVVDAYTRRFLRRHNLIENDIDYHGIQKIFMDALPQDVATYNEYHALIVRLGKDTCRPSAKCEECPLNRIEYSVKDKCTHCHRAFLDQEKNYPASLNGEGAGLLCKECRDTSRKRPVRGG